MHEPSVARRLVDETVAYCTESKVETRREDTIDRLLAKCVAYLIAKAWQCHCIVVAIGEGYVSHHHKSASQHLRSLVPYLLVERFFGSNRDFHWYGVEILHTYGILVHLLVLQFVGLAISSGANLDSFRVLSVLHLGIRRVVELHFAREILLVRLLSTLVGIPSIAILTTGFALVLRVVGGHLLRH